MNADERMLRLIMAQDADGLRVLAAWGWEALKQRLCTNDVPLEWVCHAEQTVAAAKGAK